MRVISVNVNGIRAAAKKGFFDWLEKIDADVICVQELKAQEHQLSDDVFRPSNYHLYISQAEKKGYSGVAIYSKQKPDNITVGLGWFHADNEGRYIQADFGDLSVASLYLPSGSSGEERQEVKFDFLDKFKPILETMRNSQQEFILCGDWNIAHKKIDIKNWRSNQKSSGFLPEERAWLDMLFDDIGFVDAFRLKNQEPDQYTWWSNRANAYNNNVGWRLDYQIITPGLEKTVDDVSIYKEKRFSDHAPLIVDYDI